MDRINALYSDERFQRLGGMLRHRLDSFQVVSVRNYLSNRSNSGTFTRRGRKQTNQNFVGELTNLASATFGGGDVTGHLTRLMKSQTSNKKTKYTARILKEFRNKNAHNQLGQKDCLILLKAFLLFIDLFRVIGRDTTKICDLLYEWLGVLVKKQVDKIVFVLENNTGSINVPNHRNTVQRNNGNGFQSNVQVHHQLRSQRNNHPNQSNCRRSHPQPPMMQQPVPQQQYYPPQQLQYQPTQQPVMQMQGQVVNQRPQQQPPGSMKSNIITKRIDDDDDYDEEEEEVKLPKKKCILCKIYEREIDQLNLEQRKLWRQVKVKKIRKEFFLKIYGKVHEEPVFERSSIFDPCCAEKKKEIAKKKAQVKSMETALNRVLLARRKKLRIKKLRSNQ